MARPGSSLLARAMAAAVLAYLGSRSLSFVGTSPARALRSSAPSVERGGYGGSSGGKNYWEKWEAGDYYLNDPTRLQGYEFAPGQLADGRTAGQEMTKPSSGPGKTTVIFFATILFFASVYINDQGFFNP